VNQRLLLNFQAKAEDITTDHTIDQVLQQVPNMVEALGVRL